MIFIMTISAFAGTPGKDEYANLPEDPVLRAKILKILEELSTDTRAERGITAYTSDETIIQLYYDVMDNGKVLTYDELQQLMRTAPGLAVDIRAKMIENGHESEGHIHLDFESQEELIGYIKNQDIRASYLTLWTETVVPAKAVMQVSYFVSELSNGIVPVTRVIQTKPLAYSETKDYEDIVTSGRGYTCSKCPGAGTYEVIQHDMLVIYGTKDKCAMSYNTVFVKCSNCHNGVFTYFWDFEYIHSYVFISWWTFSEALFRCSICGIEQLVYVGK